ncbi:MAG: VacJ family lipoprotein [Gammaproteobacteria bacterium]|nr:VacJ family lipoprotein [Gammaproteobacteria bacterium]
MRTGPIIQKIITFLFVLSMVGGCATVHGPGSENDPLESYNRAMFDFNEGFYDYVLDPIVDAYQFIMPEFMQTGVSNFFNHLDDILVMFNSLLQFKFRDFIHTFMRFLYNTFFGFLGLVDVAKHMGLPKLNEDFGQTLGVWGVPAGPYFVQPLLGPSTIRDTIGDYADWEYVNPINLHVDDKYTRYGLIGLSAIDTRISLLKVDSVVTKATIDKYAFVRDAYLQRRQHLVYDGNAPRDKPSFEPSSREDLELEDALEKELLQ